jgi:hypothetical protein
MPSGNDNEFVFTRFGMRELRYFLELTDGSHRDEASISFADAGELIRGMDWKTLSSPLSPSCPLPQSPSTQIEDGEEPCPFILFLDEGESFFMIMPEAEGLLITVRVLDKWNLLGLVPKERSFTLNFGLLSVDDALTLLKLFYEDNYPSLRALEKTLRTQEN